MNRLGILLLALFVLFSLPQGSTFLASKESRSTIATTTGNERLGPGLDSPNGPPIEVSVSGPPTGVIGTAYTFTAAVSPANATLPITYIWQATGQQDKVEIDRYALTHSVTYTWTSLGTKIITVTAKNDRTATSSHTIVIEVLPVQTVTISGPMTGTINTAYTFTATVSPSNATQPVLYNWMPKPMEGQGFPVVVYVWTTVGTKNITVTAMNAGGAAADTYTQTINIASEIVPVQNVMLSGPPTATAQSSHTFTATVSPITATKPITYVWQATGQASVTTTNYAPTDTIAFTWETAGTKAVTVTATNVGGADTDFRPINVSALLPAKVSLPLVARCWVSLPNTAEWEREPNNWFDQATGPLVSDKDYYGYVNDQWDFFDISLHNEGRIRVSLINHTGQGVQLQLLYREQNGEPQLCDPDKCFRFEPPYDIDYTGAAGQYYIFIYTKSGFPTCTPYILRAMFR